MVYAIDELYNIDGFDNESEPGMVSQSANYTMQSNKETIDFWKIYSKYFKEINYSQFLSFFQSRGIFA